MRKSQHETNKFSQLFSRIENVRLTLDLTWDELAKRMDANRSLFFQVKRGNCGLGKGKLRRLEELEKEAGLAPISPEVRDDWMSRTPDTLNMAERAQSFFVEAEDERREAAMYRRMAEEAERHAQQLEQMAREIQAGLKKI